MRVLGKIKIKKKKEISYILLWRKILKMSIKKDISSFLNDLFLGAISLSASDLHFEPKEKTVKIRARIDGVLQEIFLFKKEIYQSLLNRVKLISGMKINIVEKPQDGRLSLLAEEEIEVRVSTLPAEYGEALVLRILNPKTLLHLEELGIFSHQIETFKREIKKPNGMIILTGPTGSGKTTTLYAILNKIKRPEIKIITIEDPIEYHLEGISQTQVNPEAGYDFANGLSAIVRQDPDVILVGEIRDKDTAKIALQAALTGHLVLTTLHTNDAPGAIPRLVSLGADPETIASALNLAVAQRLLRKICPKCKKFRKIKKEELSLFKKNLKKTKVEKFFKFKIDEKTEIAERGGCPFCNFTGYRGRIGVFETLLVDEEMKKMILKKKAVFEIKKRAIQKGMIPLYLGGLINVLFKITTLEEVERVLSK